LAQHSNKVRSTLANQHDTGVTP